MQEMTDYAKANPGKLFFGLGRQRHRAAPRCELYAMKTGVEMTHVPYKGSAPSDHRSRRRRGAAFVRGVELGGGVRARTGRLRPLAVTTAKRDPQFPDLPTPRRNGDRRFRRRHLVRVRDAGEDAAPRSSGRSPTT
jgi:tripartite-type tricarboxylate transporter receptor subunit TctC